MMHYVVELSGALGLYVLSLFVSAYTASYFGLGPQGVIWVALIPVPSTLLAGWVIWRNLMKMDEMQLRQQLEAIGIGFALTALLTFNYGFLEGAGLPKLTMFWVWPVMCMSWVLGQIAVKLRY
jgi:hypothetical protein